MVTCEMAIYISEYMRDGAGTHDFLRATKDYTNFIHLLLTDIMVHRFVTGLPYFMIAMILRDSIETHFHHLSFILGLF